MEWLASIICNFLHCFQTRRAHNWSVPRISIAYQSVIKEKNVIKNQGGGAGGGREEREAAWARVVS